MSGWAFAQGSGSERAEFQVGSRVRHLPLVNQSSVCDMRPTQGRVPPGPKLEGSLPLREAFESCREQVMSESQERAGPD
jgi:hypothetical protein